LGLPPETISHYVVVLLLQGQREAPALYGNRSDLRPRLPTPVGEEGQGGGFKISNYAFREKAIFTRIDSLVHTLEKGDQGEPNDDPEHIAKVAGDLWAKGWGEGKKIVEVLKKCKPKAS